MPDTHTIEDLQERTSRLETELAVRQEERELFYGIFLNSPVAMAVTTLSHGRFLEVNHRFIRIFGLKREEILGRSSMELGFWPALEDRNEIIGRLIEERTIKDEIIEFQNSSGKLRKGKVSMNIVRHNGQACIVTELEDITHQEKVKQELKISEERYYRLYTKTPAMLHSIDKDGNLVNVSDYWLEKMGFSRDEVIGRKSTEFLTEASRQYAKEVALPFFYENGYCREAPYRFVKKDGEVMDILLSAVAERGPDGNIIKSLAVSQDITERKRAEEKLRQSEAHYNRILDHATALIYVKDLNGIYTYVNKAYETFINRPGSGITGCTDFDLFPEDVADSLTDVDQRVINRKQPVEIEETVPVGDGMHTFLSVKYPLIGKDNRVYGICGISTDINDRKKAERDKEHLIVQLQNAITEIKILKGIIPICAGCKKIRDDKGYWNLLENYIEAHSDAAFSHGMCPECSDKAYGNEPWYIKMKEKRDR